MLSPAADAMAPFARALADAQKGQRSALRFRRRDGSTHEVAAQDFLQPFGYTRLERALLDELLARCHPGARLLDVGCGAGRHARHLAERGFEVDAIDQSPEVVDVARRLGAPARVASIWSLPLKHEYGGALLLGNSVGLVGSLARLPPLLARLSRMTPLVVLDSVDYGEGHGQVQVCLEYRGESGAWFDWLHVARSELRAAAKPAGLRVQFLEVEDEEPYGAILSRETIPSPLPTSKARR
jgi:SAM-dependent methyltransferase